MVGDFTDLVKVDLLSMNIVFETERLILRKFTFADTKIVYDLNCDPSVTRFTHDPMQNIEQAAEVLKNVILPQYDLYNHGRWAVHEKSGLEFIGWCGLKYRPELNEIDLGYRFKRSFGEMVMQLRRHLPAYIMDSGYWISQ